MFQNSIALSFINSELALVFLCGSSNKSNKRKILFIGIYLFKITIGTLVFFYVFFSFFITHVKPETGCVLVVL